MSDAKKALERVSTYVHLFPENAFPEAVFRSTSWLLSYSDGSILIDPSIPLSAFADTEPPKALWATHGHYDHVLSVDDMRKAWSVPLYLHEEEQEQLTDAIRNGSVIFGQRTSFQPPDVLLKSEQTYTLDTVLSITVWHTPGHTPGSCCYLLCEHGEPIALFTGDTVFAGSIGRVDLPGGNNQIMAQTLQDLRNRLGELSPHLPLLPGHGPITTAGRELKRNPWLSSNNPFFF